jgi:hypothetical protein
MGAADERLFPLMLGFVIAGLAAYISRMPRKQLEVPPAVARSFARDMRAFFAEKNSIKKDEIAARQLHALRQHHASKLRLIDVRELFVQMRDQGFT